MPGGAAPPPNEGEPATAETRVSVQAAPRPQRQALTPGTGTPSTERPPTPRTDACQPPGTVPRHVSVLADSADVFIQPRVMPQPLAALAAGTLLPVTGRADEWLLISFQDPRWGTRVGYVHCTNVALAAARVADATPLPVEARPNEGKSTRPSAPEEADAVAVPTTPPKSARREKPKEETVSGYVEWVSRRLSDCRRPARSVEWAHASRTEPRANGLQHPPWIRDQGQGDAPVRRIALLARELEAKPNGIAAYEREVRQVNDQMEAHSSRPTVRRCGDTPAFEYCEAMSGTRLP